MIISESFLSSNFKTASNFSLVFDNLWETDWTDFGYFFISHFSFFINVSKANELLPDPLGPTQFKRIIEKLDIGNSSKQILNKIFSTENNKDYLDEIFEEFKKKEHLKFDNKFGKIMKILFK